MGIRVRRVQRVRLLPERRVLRPKRTIQARVKKTQGIDRHLITRTIKQEKEGLFKGRSVDVTIVGSGLSRYLIFEVEHGMESCG